MALSGLKVLDLTRVLAGPFCTMYLADLGAEVIKIEIPTGGDDTRHMGPYKNGESLYFCNVNRNKKGITLNLKSEEGRSLFLKLVQDADVVVENFRPGVMERLGLGYEDLKAINERIIYAAVSGFGSYGPYSQRPGYDIIAQAMGGMMSITGNKGDANPLRAGAAIGDILGGMNLTIGILAAVHGRSLTGKGDRVDVSLVDGIVASLETYTQRYQVQNGDLHPMGNLYPAVGPYDSFRAKDGYYILACGNNSLFKKFCIDVLHRNDLVGDLRFLTGDLRFNNQEELKVEIERWSESLTAQQAIELALKAGVPASPIYTIGDIMDDEHIANAREMIIACDHPKAGKLKINGNPVKLMDSMPRIRCAAPTLGQNNEEVYKDTLGLTNEEIQKLKNQGII